MKFVAPNPFHKSFTCPHCGVLARQYKWGEPLDPQAPGGRYSEEMLNYAPLAISYCENCGKNCLWVDLKLAYPSTKFPVQPNPDMPDDVREDYEEAALIYAMSPRGAAALLRLAVQKLMVHLGQQGKNINDDIAALVKCGLPPPVQQALDILRVTGNNAVHPGQLDANDVETAEKLFPLLNLIVEYQISHPAQLRRMFEELPAGARAGIERRDKQ